jgi:2-oxoglutarate/2-oxoacid ferredoxin oxidoreductase subunit beta
MATMALPTLTAKDFATDQEVRWCPGCGDYSILAQLRKSLVDVGVPREKMVFVSGIGCSSRLPYYMNTYGFHSIHGRAPAFATGVRLANPDLQVWVVTGDGDGLSIGGNHLIHALRRNMDLKILLFNNEIYGLTKGQYSPTSRAGTVTKSSPMGSMETPLRPLSLALASEATFVARTLDTDIAHLTMTLKRAAAHHGSAFIEIYQNCVIFNDGVFDYATDRKVRADNVLSIEHGKPMIFGKQKNRGIRLQGLQPEIAEIAGPDDVAGLLVHDEATEDPTLAMLLSRMVYPEFPEVIGVYRAVRKPTYEELFEEQVDAAIANRGPGQLVDLFRSDDQWTVE